MGRQKLAYKLNKPNKQHKYWRYTLSNDPKGRYVSARTKIRYESDRIAREAYDRSLLSPGDDYASDNYHRFVIYFPVNLP